MTGHGKDEADGHGGVFKTWLTSKMLASDIVSGEIEAADVVDGELASFADKMCEVARRGLAELNLSARPGPAMRLPGGGRGAVVGAARRAIAGGGCAVIACATTAGRRCRSGPSPWASPSACCSAPRE